MKKISDDQIRAKEVMVIGPNGEQLGVKPLRDALTLAEYSGFDLVLINPNATPQVCKIMDYNKYRYEMKKKYSKKLFIIIGIIIAVGIIAFYVYSKDNNYEEISTEEIMVKNETQTEETTDTEKIVVHIMGAVKNEGIVELEEKSRVADAIEKAGGVTENAYMKDINLATLLEDGMKIYIPTKEEIELEKNGQSGSVGNMGGVVSSSANEKNTNNGENVEIKETNKKININTATKGELDTLPGVGESTANKIISYREENGKFKTIEEIKEVSGIGDSKYEQIKDLIEI